MKIAEMSLEQLLRRYVATASLALERHARAASELAMAAGDERAGAYVVARDEAAELDREACQIMERINAHRSRLAPVQRRRAAEDDRTNVVPFPRVRGRGNG